MDGAQTVKRYQKVGGWVGALLVGGLFLLVACLQPLDGVPGYRYVTPEDSSILWGFALSFVVGAVVGGMLGIWLGGRLGRKSAARQGLPAGAPAPEPAAPPAFTAPAYPPAAAPDAGRIGEEFRSLLAEGVFQKAEEYLSRGQQPDQTAVAQYATDRAASILMVRYHIGPAEMARIIEQELQKQ